MARYNLENNIREKLSSRELQPSDNAWKKLAAQMNSEPKVKKMRVWYYVAASFIGLLMVGTFLYTQEKITPQSQIVEDKVIINPVENPVNEIIPEPEIESVIVAEESPQKIEKKTEPLAPKQEVVKPFTSQENSKYEVVADRGDDEKTKIVDEDFQITEEEHYLNQKAQEVASTIKALQEDKGDLKLEEVEALLENARNEIFIDRILNKSQVNALSLLEEVEWELDKSFYDKVFETLGDGFKRIVTAYSERNK